MIGWLAGRRPGRAAALLAVVVAAGPAARAGVVQVDVRALFDADVVVNDGTGTLDPTQQPIDSGSVATGNFAFPTRSVAIAHVPPGGTPDGLPDDASFPATAFHPDVRLGWDNADDGDNARRIAFATGSFAFPVGPAACRELHLFATGGDGDADLVVRLEYEDLTSDVVPIHVPDWFDDPPETPDAYRVFDGGDRMQPGSGPGVPFEYQDRNDPAIFGFRLLPDPAKRLVRVQVDRTDATGVLDFFGATAVTADGPDLYEAATPAAVVQPANRVATGIVSPYPHTPAAGPVRFLQADDGAGAPGVIRLERAATGVRVHF